MKSVKVDTLPECDVGRLVDDRVESKCEVQAAVIDARKDILNLREAKAQMLEQQQKREEEL